MLPFVRFRSDSEPAFAHFKSKCSEISRVENAPSTGLDRNRYSLPFDLDAWVAVPTRSIGRPGDSQDNIADRNTGPDL